MSSANAKPGAPSKATQSGTSGAAASNQSIVLEKLNVRQSTPDSEALASSDDESELHRPENLMTSLQTQKPVRRSSWLNDTSQIASHPRKGSFASGSMSPTTSHPGTPAVEPGVSAWSSHAPSSSFLNRTNNPVPGTFTWGTGIWSRDRDAKEPPSRLTEVLPSPTSVVPPGGSGSFFASDGGMNQPSPVSKESMAIPFPIPLHPTPKTYRSQSYSVGQLDPESTSSFAMPSAVLGARGRGLPHSGLQHRPSRPSMLSEIANDSILGKVNEDEDNDSNRSLQTGTHQSADLKAIEVLARENALLRQAHQYRSLRPRTSSGYGLSNGYLQDPVPEESDYAVDELDELNDGSDLMKQVMVRRMSEYTAAPYKGAFMAENRKLENVKRAAWQSSLGLPMADIPQSRRHSFVDVPTRQGSISSIGEVAITPHESGSQEPAQEYSTLFAETMNHPAHLMSNYFIGGVSLTSPQASMPQGYPPQYPSPYAAFHATYPNKPASPHRSIFGMPQPRHNPKLYIVLFKCSRAEVFYIQEGTGLKVKTGDLVIVEADRGTDLGTVAKENVDWEMAKKYKEQYAEEQYKWLMMYSQNAAAAQEGAGAGLMAASNGLQGGAMGGMGPPNQHHIQEPNSGELKPKLIKRLAQNHEIHALRDKEGNEAKAKRVCMQKVKEHNLSMEILDAEFQMDWKKLTFYYFADAYINFNSLVTDLFKIYKTRIWMSAINPASFASPTLGLQPPSGVGPGAIERRQNQQSESQPTFNVSSQNTRGTTQSFTPSYGPDRPMMTPAYQGPNFPYNPNPYGAFGNVGRPALPYGTGMMPGGLDGFAGSFAQPGDFAVLNNRFQGARTGTSHDQPISQLTNQVDWVGAIQGLSLNTR